MKPDAERHENTNKEMSMSKAKYHVPQPGEMVEFTTKRGLRARTTVSSWDAKHGIILSINSLHYAVGDRSTIKLVAPAPTATPKPVKVDAPEPRPRTEEHLFREPVAVSTEFTARLPTSFASEVARAQAIADAEAENKKRHEAADAKVEELAGKITALVSERCDVMAEDENAQQDHENRLEYLRALRVRQDR